jgi:hypothetical protein
MTRMVRKQLYMDAETDRRLAERAELLGVSQAEIVRIAVDEYLSGTIEGAPNPGWEELKVLIDRIRARGPVPGGGGERSWKREDLYDRF